MYNIIFSFLFLLSSNNSLLIGDSQASSIKNNSKLVLLDSTLQKVGWNVANLCEALMVHSVDENIKKVFISIGTNGAYSVNDNINLLCRLLKDKFPNADLYVIVGSYGWGNNKTVTSDMVEKYYNRFEINGVIRLENQIGYCTSHPDTKTPTIIKIGEEIDRLIYGR